MKKNDAIAKFNVAWLLPLAVETCMRGRRQSLANNKEITQPLTLSHHFLSRVLNRTILRSYGTVGTQVLSANLVLYLIKSIALHNWCLGLTLTCLPKQPLRPHGPQFSPIQPHSYNLSDTAGSPPNRALIPAQQQSSIRASSGMGKVSKARKAIKALN